jgi:predicted amidohydrolase YtcJ
VLDIFKQWKAKGQLNVRTFCIGGAAAGNPEAVERSLKQIPQMKLFQGDEYIDDVFFGESVYTPLHDPMFATRSDPKPEQLELWKRMAMEIAKAGLPLHVHAELENTIDRFLDQIEDVNKQHSIKNLRWTLAHVNQLNASHLERMKKLGMYAAVHPWGVINAGIFHETFGDAAANELSPFDTIQKSGIAWGFGSDGSAANQYIPMTALHYAVTGKLASGRKVIRQTISREDALIAYTRKNAYFVFHEDDLGSIQPGKVADMVVLDRDYLTVPADEIKDIKPVQTFVGGRMVYNAEPVVGSR